MHARSEYALTFQRPSHVLSHLPFLAELSFVMSAEPAVRTCK